MDANPYYGGKKPAIQRIQMTVASGDVCAAQLRAFEADEVDFATCVPSQDIARVQRGCDARKASSIPFPSRRPNGCNTTCRARPGPTSA